MILDQGILRPMELLYALLLFASRDTGAPGIRGKLAFGVQTRGEDGTDVVTWLQVRFDHRAIAGFVATPDEDTHAAILVGEQEADARWLRQSARIPCWRTRPSVHPGRGR